MSLALALALALLAALLAGVQLVRTRGQDILAWAVLALAIAGASSRL